MEIQVGEYVRTKDGFIRKIDKIEKCPVCKEKEYINNEIIRGLHFQNTYHKKDITKHSEFIGELIEIGDYLNGFKVEVKWEDAEHYRFAGCDYYYNIDDSQIESIVTKEQFEREKYKV